MELPASVFRQAKQNQEFKYNYEEFERKQFGLLLAILKPTKQDLECMQQAKSKREGETFCRMVDRYREERKMSWAKIAQQGGVSKATTTRIKNNTDCRGNDFRPSLGVIVRMTIALGIGTDGLRNLLQAAEYPSSMEELMTILEIMWKTVLEPLLNDYTNVSDANEWLYDQGLPLFGIGRNERSDEE